MYTHRPEPVPESPTEVPYETLPAVSEAERVLGYSLLQERQRLLYTGHKHPHDHRGCPKVTRTKQIQPLLVDSLKLLAGGCGGRSIGMETPSLVMRMYMYVAPGGGTATFPLLTHHRGAGPGPRAASFLHPPSEERGEAALRLGPKGIVS